MALRVQRDALTSEIALLQQELAELNGAAASFSPATMLGSASFPRSPARPNLLVNVFLALLGGLLLGFGIAAIAEYMDQRVRGATDLRTRLGVPVLGLIPGIERRGRPSIANASGNRRPCVRRRETPSVDSVRASLPEPLISGLDPWRSRASTTTMSPLSSPRTLRPCLPQRVNGSFSCRRGGVSHRSRSCSGRGQGQGSSTHWPARFPSGRRSPAQESTTSSSAGACVQREGPRAGLPRPHCGGCVRDPGSVAGHRPSRPSHRGARGLRRFPAGGCTAVARRPRRSRSCGSVRRRSSGSPADDQARGYRASARAARARASAAVRQRAPLSEEASTAAWYRVARIIHGDGSREGARRRHDLGDHRPSTTEQGTISRVTGEDAQ